MTASHVLIWQTSYSPNILIYLLYFIVDKGGAKMSPLWDMTTTGGGQLCGNDVHHCPKAVGGLMLGAGPVPICAVCDRA